MLQNVIKIKDGKVISGQQGGAFDITWDEWQELSDQEKEGTLWHITNVPGADGSIDANLLTKLWENPSPTSAFAAQTITLNSDDYDFLLVCMKDSNGTCSVDRIIKKDFVTNYIGTSIAMANSSMLRTRVFGKTDDTHLTITDGSQVLLSSPSTVSTNNGILIPNEIYGFKKTVNIKFDALAENVSTSASKCMLDENTSVGTFLANNIIIKRLITSAINATSGNNVVDISSYNINTSKATVLITGHSDNYGCYAFNLTSSSFTIYSRGAQTVWYMLIEYN